MMKFLDDCVRWSQVGISLLILLIIILGIICACDAFGNTWTIEDGHFKEVYDNIDECKKSNLGTGTIDKCYDDNQVIYKNR